MMTSSLKVKKAALKAMKGGATKVGATKAALKAMKVGATKAGATKVGATKVGATKAGATKVGATKARATKVGATKADDDENALVCALSAMQVKQTDIDWNEVGWTRTDGEWVQVRTYHMTWMGASLADFQVLGGRIVSSWLAENTPGDMKNWSMFGWNLDPVLNAWRKKEVRNVIHAGSYLEGVTLDFVKKTVVETWKAKDDGTVTTPFITKIGEVKAAKKKAKKAMKEKKALKA